MDKRVRARKQRRELLKGLNNTHTKPIWFKKGAEVPQWVQKTENAVCTFGVDVYAVKFNNEVLLVPLEDINKNDHYMMRVDCLDKEKQVNIQGSPTMFWNSLKCNFGYCAIKEYVEDRKNTYIWIKEGLQYGQEYFDRYKERFESMQREGFVN